MPTNFLSNRQMTESKTGGSGFVVKALKSEPLSGNTNGRWAQTLGSGGHCHLSCVVRKFAKHLQEIDYLENFPHVTYRSHLRALTLTLQLEVN